MVGKWMHLPLGGMWGRSRIVAPHWAGDSAMMMAGAFHRFRRGNTASPQGSAPHFSFWRPKKRNGLRPVQREKTLCRAPVQLPSARTEVGVSMSAPIWAGLRARYGLLRVCNCRPVADGADLIEVVVALSCFSFRCRSMVPQRTSQRVTRGKRSWSNAVLHPQPLSAPSRGDWRTSLNRPRRARGVVIANTGVPSHVQPPYDKRPLGLRAQSRV